ncbi:DUF2850 domain-containing protein [Vibrio hippocampi]|uniref:DUF2850 domain-containing protein n=1 Tax=Vibrio hippocampi TaxID=654686 RepID=A0ABN8DMR4_9VIBR|nr:DUF2850 domain-containing protein [Vibrio hippocampi]CAH0530227.1 hypothetical protein VHP8226_03910 [Vibrio hippocampi]
MAVYRDSRQTYMMIGLGTIFLSLVIIIVMAFVTSKGTYVAPDNIHGEWIEIGTPNQQTEVLQFSDRGVHRDYKLIATKYQFNGRIATVKTGSGLWVYEKVGSKSSPQLRRITPRMPPQRFILKGYQHTLSGSSSGSGTNRRDAVKKHFGD